MQLLYPILTPGQKAKNTRRYKLVEKCSYPEIIHLYEEIRKAEFDFEDAFDRDSFIAKNIGPTTWTSYCRFGNRRGATPTMIVFWINKKAMPLDEQALFMSGDYGHEILPEDLADFIKQHERGTSYFGPIEKIKQLKKLFKEKTGFAYNQKWIRVHLIENHITDNPF